MKIAGVIAEYNPFHNGHRYHLAQTRARTGCDFVAVCLTGSFTQRGEPALLSKWTRARMALLGGADAVFELPALFAVRTADWFARGGVGVLAALGCDALSFGSEIDDLPLLARLAELRENEPETLSALVRTRLDAGMSHARARGAALEEHLSLEAGTLNRPNAALAVEYLRCLGQARKRDGRAPAPLLVPRRGDYHGEALEEICSATAVRRALDAGEDVSRAVPANCLPLLPTARRLPLDMALLYCLRQGEPALPDAGEGLGEKIGRAARMCGTLEDVIAAVKSRRYTRARIVRAMAHAAAGLTAELAARHEAPSYARLLGLRADAEGLMAELCRRTRIPVVSDPTTLSGDACFQLECRFTDLWALGEPAPADRRAGRDFTERFVRV